LKHTIVDEGDPRKYWSQIPNLICDLGLPAQALALYLQIKRAAGESGVCFKSTRTLAQALKVGTGTVVRAKALLEQPLPQIGNRPLIKTVERTNPKGGKPYHEIRVTDIWHSNMKTFTSANMELDSQVPESARQVPNNGAQVPKASANMELKKNTREEEPVKKKPQEEIRTPAGVTLFRDITGFYPKKELFALVNAAFGAAPDEIFARECYREWSERGYNPRSLKWLTDWFAHHALPPSRNGNGKGHSKAEGLDAVREVLAEIREGRA